MTKPSIKCSRIKAWKHLKIDIFPSRVSFHWEPFTLNQRLQISVSLPNTSTELINLQANSAQIKSTRLEIILRHLTFIELHLTIFTNKNWPWPLSANYIEITLIKIWDIRLENVNIDFFANREKYFFIILQVRSFLKVWNILSMAPNRINKLVSWARKKVDLVAKVFLSCDYFYFFSWFGFLWF